MLTKLCQKSKITIPKELIDKLGLLEGDALEIYEQDGIICIEPVAVYPESYIAKLQKDVEEIKRKVVAGQQPVFKSVSDMMMALESED